MCVIVYVNEDNKRPTDQEVEAMWDHNPDGGGVAWREDGLVHWEKGLNLVEMKARNLNLPSPYVLHFRIASAGGKSIRLTHPFPIEKSAPLELRGSTKTGVLFHNGTLSNWTAIQREWTKPGLMEFPEGPWSDSRVMAWLMAHYCPKNLGFMTNLFEAEKLLVMTPQDVKISGTQSKMGWQLYQDRFLVSNDFFEFRLPKQSRRQAKDGNSDSPHTRNGGTEREETGNTQESKNFYLVVEEVMEDLPGGGNVLVKRTRKVPIDPTPPGQSQALVPVQRKTSLDVIDGAPEVPAKIPFLQALRDFRQGKVSKKVLKKAFKRYQREVQVAIQQTPTLH